MVDDCDLGMLFEPRGLLLVRDDVNVVYPGGVLVNGAERIFQLLIVSKSEVADIIFLERQVQFL